MGLCKKCLDVPNTFCRPTDGVCDRCEGPILPEPPKELAVEYLAAAIALLLILVTALFTSAIGGTNHGFQSGVLCMIFYQVVLINARMNRKDCE